MTNIRDSREHCIRSRKYLERSKTGHLRAQYPEIDELVLKKYQEARQLGLGVSQEDFIEYAKEAVKVINESRSVDEQITDLQASKGWVARFINRHKLSSRSPTSVGQKIPANAKELALKFFDYVKQWKERQESGPVIGNMDEIPMYFDAPSRRTYDLKGVKTVLMKTTGKEKMRFTLIMTILADGKKCRAMLIFKNLKKAPKPSQGKTWPSNVFVTGTKGGSMNIELMYLWNKEVWQKRPGYFYESKDQNALLIMDSFRAHIKKSLLKNLKRVHKTDVAIVPGGMTPLIQPLDVAINRSIKAKFSAKWKDWMKDTQKRFQITKIKEKITYSLIVNWISEIVHEIDSELVKNSFRMCAIGVIREEVELHTKLNDIILTGQTEEVDNEHTGVTDDEDDDDEGPDEIEIDDIGADSDIEMF